MKKFVVLFIFVIGLFPFASGQSYSQMSQEIKLRERKISVAPNEFNGNKPLKADKDVGVIFPGQILPINVLAYKGETEKTFLERINKKDSVNEKNFVSVMDSLFRDVYQEDQQAAKKAAKDNSSKEERGLYALLVLGVFFLFLFGITYIFDKFNSQK